MTIGGLPLPGPDAADAAEDEVWLDVPELLAELLLDELPQAATTTAITMAVSAPRARAT
ncbi:MAG: hypothetical protein ABI323_04060 [Solirubrobacteraceae bacterium]